MSTHRNERTTSERTERKSATPDYPDAYPVGEHLVIDRTEWVPGRDPEPHRRHDGQRAYRESYYRCLKCGDERQAKRYFPDHCDGDPTSQSL